MDGGYCIFESRLVYKIFEFFAVNGSIEDVFVSY